MNMNQEIRWQLRVIQLLSLGGVVLAYYLWLFHKGDIIVQCGGSPVGNALNGFGLNIDCFSVSGPTAEKSEILGKLPVATIGFIGYIALFVTIWLGDMVRAVRRFVPYVTFLFSLVAIIFTAWLTWLEYKMDAYCLYCLYSAAIIVIIFILSAWALWKEQQG